MTAPASPLPPEFADCRIVVTVGTDHHPFDRLIRWTNEWLADHPEMAGSCFVQSGASSVRPNCRGSEFLEVGILSALMDAADVVICHGGPATIAETWARSKKPIVAPRLAGLGEHVDDHQADFCEQLAELGKLALARTQSDFAGLVDAALSDSSQLSATSSGSDADEAAARLAELVEELISRQRRRAFTGRRQRVGRVSASRTGDPARGVDPSPESSRRLARTGRPAQCIARASP
jgi:UDP-N-acetylglucosamine transferase subunit ALG13